jgi:hypothetical protein
MSRETPPARNTLAIPPAIAAQGGNHIGDVDIANGKVYAPIEDGTKRPDGTRYLHPVIALFDARTCTRSTSTPATSSPSRR